jgi:hypothetical protein
VSQASTGTKSLSQAEIERRFDEAIARWDAEWGGQMIEAWRRNPPSPVGGLSPSVVIGRRQVLPRKRGGQSEADEVATAALGLARRMSQEQLIEVSKQLALVQDYAEFRGLSSLVTIALRYVEAIGNTRAARRGRPSGTQDSAARMLVDLLISEARTGLESRGAKNEAEAFLAPGKAPEVCSSERGRKTWLGFVAVSAKCIVDVCGASEFITKKDIDRAIENVRRAERRRRRTGLPVQ